MLTGLGLGGEQGAALRKMAVDLLLRPRVQRDHRELTGQKYILRFDLLILFRRLCNLQ